MSKDHEHRIDRRTDRHAPSRAQGEPRTARKPPPVTRARAYTFELPEPFEIRRKCSCCGYPLGVQNPGWVCDTCKHTK